MKNSYETKLRKNKTLPHEIRQEKTKRYYRKNDIFNNGIKLSTYSENKKKEIKTKELELDKHSLTNSFYHYYKCIPNNDSTKNKISYNNHSLFDSNKQKIIKPQNNNNCVQFFPKNHNNLNIDKIPLYNLRNIYISEIKPKFIGEYHNQYLKKVDVEDKYEKKINNIKNKDKNQINNHFFNNANKNFSNKITLTNNSKTKKNSKDNKYSNKSLNFTKYKNRHPKNFTIHNRNKFFNFSNNLTEVNSNYDDFSPNKSISNYRKKEYYIKENIKENNYINNNTNTNTNNVGNTYQTNKNYKYSSRNKENSPSSFMEKKAFNSSTNIYNKRSNRLHISTDKYINKTNKNLNKDKLKSIMPIELNIGYTNKEKLSRLKSIIERSSANHNFFQIDFPNNIRNKEVKSEDKKNYLKDKKENNEKMIFKKKKIKMRLNEENKDEDINYNINIDKNYGNNYLITSPANKNKVYKRNVMLKNGIIKDNNQIQSLVASYNLFVQNEKQKLSKNNENKLSSKETDHTSHLNNNKESKSLNKNIYKKKNVDIINNNDDTISLSYSKEQNISLCSKNKKIEERSICLPFLQEHFNISYNKYNKQLIINDKNKFYDNNNNKINGIFIDSDDDDYQLTKEIILLKKGLAKKTELSREIKRKIKKLRPERVYNLSLFGNKRIYKKKSSNYRSFKFYI